MSKSMINHHSCYEDNILESPKYGVSVSQLIHYARACMFFYHNKSPNILKMDIIVIILYKLRNIEHSSQ